MHTCSVTKCLPLCYPKDCSLPGYSVHEICQARILEWVAISFSRGSSLYSVLYSENFAIRRLFFHLMDTLSCCDISEARFFNFCIIGPDDSSLWGLGCVLQYAMTHSTKAAPLKCQQQRVVTVKNVFRQGQMPLEGKIIPIENRCSIVVCSPLVL